jgi:hypothetical protein
MEDDFQTIVDETEDDLDISQEIQDGQSDPYDIGSIPQSKESQSLYTWFWKLVKENKPMRSIKVGRLSRQEIGDCNIPIRESLNLNELGKTFHHPTFGKFFATHARNIAASSMARDGWLMELSISQKKVRERQRALSSPQSDNKQPWRVFKKK